MTVTADQIEGLYQSVLHRPSDSGGLTFYADLGRNGATLSELESMFRASSEYANLASAPPAPAPAPPPPPVVSTGGATGPAPVTEPPAPLPNTGGASVDTAIGAPATAADQWVPWASNTTVKIGGVAVLAVMLLSGSSGGRR